jgi:hypothetical protein
MKSTIFVAWVIALSMPEAWAWMTPYDLWASDQIAVGVLIATLGACAWRVSPFAAICAVVIGMARTSCVAIWPTASDAAGSICDAQTGMPLTVGVLAMALYALGRLSRGP